VGQRRRRGDQPGLARHQPAPRLDAHRLRGAYAGLAYQAHNSALAAVVRGSHMRTVYPAEVERPAGVQYMRDPHLPCKLKLHAPSA